MRGRVAAAALSGAALLAAGVVGLVVALAGDDRPPLDRAAGEGAGMEAPTTTVVERPRGGSVRVGVWSEPDPALPTAGGAGVRSLTWPSLFVAQPDGSWAPSLVEPGSVAEAPGRRSVSFRLRPGAVWSDGSPITADDLRRTADARFVARVGGPAPDGTITVELTHPIRGWQRLWSGADAIAPPSAGVSGGPFVVAGRTPGLETVLARNDRWWGPGPWLDEVRLVLVPDPATLGQLFERGELDVVMPLAATALERAVAEVEGAAYERVEGGGWWFGLVTNPDEMKREHRAALLASVERMEFPAVLLAGEASVLDGFSAASPGGVGAGPWAGIGPGDVSALRGRAATEVTGYVEVPMSTLLQRSMQKRTRAAGATIELRNAEADLVVGWLAGRAYDAALVYELDPPWPCWTCRWGHVDADLAAAADGGSPAAVAALQERLRDEALVLPIWRPVTTVAWRDGIGGVRANGFAASAAWNAAEWWRER